MLIKFAVNWRINLFVSLLLLAAIQSCTTLERPNLILGWWLDFEMLQGTTQQVVKKQVKLPTWYVYIHYILWSIRNPLKIDKNKVIMNVSKFLLIVGITCLFLGIWLAKGEIKETEDGGVTGWNFFAIIRGCNKKSSTTVLSLQLGSKAKYNEMRIKKLSVASKQLSITKEEEESRQIAESRAYCKQKKTSICSKYSGKRKVKAKKDVKAIEYTASTKKQMKKLYQSLSEKDKRRYAGVEALKIGKSGITFIASMLECDRKTVRKGIKELKNLSKRQMGEKRIRKKGGGRKPYSDTYKNIDKQFMEVLKEHTAGNPMKEEVVWTNLKPQKIKSLLEQDYSIKVSNTVVYQLLKENNYRQRGMLKKETMKQVSYRNQQFENIARLKAEYQASPNPIISVDTKKKEYIGNFYRAGRLYNKQLLHCYDHDFKSFAQGVIIPHGIYDLKQNNGYMHLGTSHDTSEFACECIRNWWLKYGRYSYPDAHSILILCDGGGSNSSRSYLFKQDIQKLANEIGIEIRITHYPPYCSRFNPIEHRLFPHVTRACQGVIFKNIGLVKSLIESTSTRQGLEVKVDILDRFYSTGRKSNDDFKQNMSIVADEFLPKLNYKALSNGEVI